MTIQMTDEHKAALKSFPERDAIRYVMTYAYASNGGGKVNRLDVQDIVLEHIEPILPYLGRRLTSSVKVTFNAEEYTFSRTRGFIERGDEWDSSDNLHAGESVYVNDGFAAAVDYYNPRLDEFVALMKEIGLWTLGDVSRTDQDEEDLQLTDEELMEINKELAAKAQQELNEFLGIEVSDRDRLKAEIKEEVKAEIKAELKEELAAVSELAKIFATGKVTPIKQ